MAVHKDMKTNYYYILQYGAERTILVKHHPYPKLIPNFAEPPKWLYFSSSGENDFQNSVGRYCVENGVKLAFQPNTEQIKAGREAQGRLCRIGNIHLQQRRVAGYLENGRAG